MKCRRPVLLIKVLLVAVLAACAGCAGIIENRNLPDDERVRIRAQGWADALLEDDLKAAYAYTSPAYRTASTMGAYNARVEGRTNWESMKVKSVDCSGDVCDVKYVLEYRLGRSSRTNTRSMHYRWVKTDDQWWLHVSPR